MATANEIEAYNGDPRLGFGSNVAAGETGLAWDLSGSDAAWGRFAQNKLNVAKDLNDQLKKKQLQAQEEVAKLLDQDQYKIWAADRETFKPLWNDFQKNVIDVAKRGKWGDVNDPDFEKVLTQAQNLRQFAQFSTQQEKHWDVGFNDFQKNKDQYDPNSEAQLNTYRDIADPIKRAETDYSLSPASGFDLPKIVKDLETQLTTGKKTRSTTHKDQYGQLVTDIEDVQQMDLSELPARLDDLYETDPKIRRTADAIFSDLTPEQQAALDNNPAQTLQAPVLGRIKATTTEKQRFAADWLAQFNTRSATTIPHDEEFSFNVTDQSGVTEKKNAINKELTTLNNKATKTDADKKRITELQGELKSTTGSTKTVYGVGGGYRVGKTSENPRGINLFVKTAHLTGGDNTGKQVLSQNDIGSNAWTVDVVGRTNVYKLPNGKYLYTEDPNENQNLPTEDVVIVNSDAGGLYGTPQTILIPYEDIATQLKNAKILFEPNDAAQPQDKEKKSAPKTLSGKIDPSTLVKGEQYIVNGKPYIWDGTKLKPQ